MFVAARSGQRRRDNSNRSLSPMSRSEKKGFAIVFCVLFLLFGFLLSDFVALPVNHVYSAVVNKEYLPSRRSITSTGAPRRISEKWQLSFNIERNLTEAQVSHEFYDQVSVSDILRVSYARSRIFHEIKIVSVFR